MTTTVNPRRFTIIRSRPTWRSDRRLDKRSRADFSQANTSDWLALYPPERETPIPTPNPIPIDPRQAATWQRWWRHHSDVTAGATAHAQLASRN